MTEQGRWDDEGPRREVELTRGFWLADTPCTQELWQTVMRTNPSWFQSPTRPVEQVSWEECQEFLIQIAKKVPDLELRFPSEAEWEYACRAGTETSTYVGELEILGDKNGPLLDTIAWYGGNSGVDFELYHGFDSSDWAEMQYPAKRMGTHPVAEKEPNRWGLYDMLGNVYEWCSDFWSTSYEGAASVDPSGPEQGSFRVFRGGSWYSDARYLRAAYRYCDHPGFRSSLVGLRLARGPGNPERGAPGR